MGTRGHKVEKTSPGREKRATYAPYKEKTVQKYSEKVTFPKKQHKKEKGKTTVLCLKPVTTSLVTG